MRYLSWMVRPNHSEMTNWVLNDKKPGLARKSEEWNKLSLGGIWVTPRTIFIEFMLCAVF